MFIDYTNSVLKDYEKKRANNALSTNLTLPTPASLKNECLNVCSEKFVRTDGGILSAFFGAGDTKETALKAIDRIDKDKLKPLQYYLKGKTESPDPKVVELLAWLIDFKPRPFQHGREYKIEDVYIEDTKVEKIDNQELEHIEEPIAPPIDEQPDKTNGNKQLEAHETEQIQIPTKDAALKDKRATEKTELPEISEQHKAESQMPPQIGDILKDTTASQQTDFTEIENDSDIVDRGKVADNLSQPPIVDTSDQTKKNVGKRPPGTWIKYAASGIVAIGIAVFAFYKTGGNDKIENNSSKPLAFIAATKDNESCMYWTGDHYEQTSCNQKHGDTLIIALDSTKLLHFKKITRPDTITKNAIGHVWYIKINREIEFYTSDGNHPLDEKRRLKPITAYMIDKYIPTKN